MLKFWQNKKLSEQEKTRSSTKEQPSGTKSTSLSPKEIFQVESLQLYDTPKKILVERFYEIVQTNNLLLLLAEDEPGLNEAQKFLLNQRLSDTWLLLQEFYYSRTNGQKYERFKSDMRRVQVLENEITTCKAAAQLAKLGDPYGYEVLNEFGIRSTEDKSIEQAILRKETKLDFAKSKLTKQSGSGGKEESGFYEMLSSVEGHLGMQLDTATMNLERWVAYLGRVKQKIEAEKQAVTKKKNVRTPKYKS